MTTPSPVQKRPRGHFLPQIEHPFDTCQGARKESQEGLNREDLPFTKNETDIGPVRCWKKNSKSAFF
jgi:hypothetical protein